VKSYTNKEEEENKRDKDKEKRNARTAAEDSLASWLASVTQFDI
jgi:hypothetical protein